MKNLLLVLLCWFTSIPFISSQNDLQWMVRNNLGKQGTNSAITENLFQNSIGTSFTLYNVAHPNLTSNTSARNDLFVIYSDGLNFNSWNQPNPGFFAPQNASHQNDTYHSFIPSHGGVAYMYLSKRYEGDDPPKNVRVYSPTGTTNPDGQNNPSFTFGTTASLLSADHNVALTRDITIIMNYDSLRSLSKYIDPDGQVHDMILRYDEVVSNSDIHTITNYLDPMPIFATGTANNFEAGFPHNMYSTLNAGQANLKVGNSKYRYINLRAGPSAAQFGPDQYGNVKYKALFTVKDPGGATLATMQLPILSSYDPNFLRLDSICPASDGSKIIFYHLQFRNTSREQSATHISVKFVIPTSFSETCVEVTERALGNKSFFSNKNEYSKTDNQITVSFPGGSLSSCPDIDKNATDCTGYINFKIKVPKALDLHDARFKLSLDNLQVTFDENNYPVHDFRDWLTFVGDSTIIWSRPIKKEGSCDCIDPCASIICRIPRMVFYIVGIGILLFLSRGIMRKRNRNNR